MQHLYTPGWPHFAVATVAAILLGYSISWGMDRLFLRRLVTDRVTAIALSCAVTFVVMMAGATFILTWTSPFYGRPVVLPPIGYALCFLLGLAVVGVLRMRGYAEDYERNDDVADFEVDWDDQSIYDEEVLAFDRKHAHKNYFRRHWAGHLPLPVAYWVNNALLSAAILAAATFLTEKIRVDWGSLRGIAIVALVYLVICIIVWVWSSVGIWRSAYWHRRRGGSPGWGFAARALVVVSAVATIFSFGDIARQATELGTLATGRDSIGAIAEMTVSDDRSELAVRGNLANGAAARFENLFASSPSVRTVVLTSRGGRMLEAERMAELIRERGADTKVQAYCMSACTSVLLAGRERTAPEGARIGFHQPSFPGTDAYQMHDAIERTRAEYLAAGVSAPFVSRALATPAESMWFPEPDELVEAKVLTGSAVMVATPGGGSRRETLVEMRLRRGMAAEAASVNEAGPRRIGPMTVLERASASGTTLSYHYRLDTDETLFAGGSRALERVLRRQTCSDVRTALAVQEGGTFVHSYSNRKGRPLAKVAINRCP